MIFILKIIDKRGDKVKGFEKKNTKKNYRVVTIVRDTRPVST